MAIEGQSASASRAAAARGPATSASRTTAIPSSPRSNVAGAIRWQYAEPTHRSRSTVIFILRPVLSAGDAENYRRAKPAVAQHVPDGFGRPGQFEPRKMVEQLAEE